MEFIWHKNTGTMPVSKGTLIDVRYFDGKEHHNVRAGHSSSADNLRGALNWELNEYPSSIAAWRVHHEPDADGWIPWPSGITKNSPPVPDPKVVLVKQVNGLIRQAIAGDLNWTTATGLMSRIIAWKLAEPKDIKDLKANAHKAKIAATSWKKWPTGRTDSAPPVPPGTLVEVKLANGTVRTATAGDFTWATDDPCQTLIVAWKFVQPSKPKTSLYHCFMSKIAQLRAEDPNWAEWRGTCLPSAGRITPDALVDVLTADANVHYNVCIADYIWKFQRPSSNPQYNVVCWRLSKSEPIPTPQEDTIMKFETRYFLNDKDIATMTDDAIWDKIGRAEAQIKRLKAIKNKPATLKARIKDIQDNITALVVHLDKHNGATTDETA